MADLVHILCEDSHTPSRSAAKHEGIEAVQVAMAGLPEDYREAIRLRYLEQKSVEEVAAAMGRSAAAIRGLLDRAKKKMRAAMGRSSLYFSRK
jgi:RNA polymerase sigma-70 factor (ECF subfamily)